MLFGVVRESADPFDTSNRFLLEIYKGWHTDEMTIDGGFKR